MDLENKAVTRLKAGGRKKRGPNKLLYAGEVAASHLHPLDHMLGVMRDPTASPKLRLAMAARALPYCQPRLKSVKPPPPAPDVPTKIEVKFIGPDGKPVDRPPVTIADTKNR